MKKGDMGGGECVREGVCERERMGKKEMEMERERERRKRGKPTLGS